MDTESDPKYLLKKICSVIRKEPSGYIKINAFWNLFANEHDWMPQPSKFGVLKRSHLFRLFPNTINVELRDNESFVCLKDSGRKMHNRSNQAHHQNPIFPQQNVAYPFAFPPPLFPQPSSCFNLDVLNKEAEECINSLSESKEYVSCLIVEQKLLAKHGVSSVSQLGLMNINQLPCIQQLLKLEALVTITIEGFISKRTICTLYDLDLCIIDLLKANTSNKYSSNVPCQWSSFEDLKLGPLRKLPIVVHLFKVPQGKPIFELTTMNLLTSLVEYLNRKHAWHKQINVEEFMEHMKNVNQVEDAMELGVKITNFPLVIQSVKRSCSKNSEFLARFLDSCETDLRRNVKDAFSDFRNTVLSTMEINSDSDDNVMIREDLFKKKPVDVVKYIFSKLHYLFVKIQEHSNKYVEVNRTQKIIKDSPLHKITTLREFLQKDELVGQVFHIALCCSHDQIVCELDRIFNVPERNKPSAKPLSALSSDEVVARVLQYLEGCIENGSLSLATLSKIEEKIVSDMQLSNFVEFFERGFLTYLVDNSETKKLLEENGATSLGSSAGVNSGGAFRASTEELKDFVRQCLRFGGSENSKVIKRVICHHYKVSDIQEIGVHGKFKKMVKSLKSKSEAQTGSNNYIYESALLGKCLKESITSEKKIGLHGSMSRDQALLCLHSCPLLHDLSRWSNWDLVFKPEHGDLKSFLKQNGGVQQVLHENKMVQVEVIGLETLPGTLLKLRVSSSREDFERGVKARDARATCGHFVSCLVNQGGAKYFSEELFANTLKASLLESGANKCGNAIEQRKIIDFILDCLYILPDMIASTLSQKVFLEPINEILGNSRSKELLLEAAKSDIQKLNKLELLGLAGGISLWFEKSFEGKITPKEFDKPEIKRDASVDKKRKRTRTDSPSGMMDDRKEKCKPPAKKSVQDATEKKPVFSRNKVFVTQSISSSVDVVSVGDSSDDDVVMEVKVTNDAGIFDPSSKSYWQSLVEDIRRNEFGMGVGLSKDGEELLKKQQDRLGRSLERLSVDLYSKDTHFLLELVQNADDNQYPGEEGCMPSLQFRLCKDSIIILNNELGFRDIDLRAICDVGRTTKGKHKLGYIGQKGIGFKSVFRITDCPEVHSRGLHIKFDLKSGSLGYILPHWIGSKGSICTDNEVMKDGRYTTKFVLPMKKEEHTRDIQSKFRDLHPTLLLFLHRLKQITIRDEIKDEMTTMMRIDLGDNITEIIHNGVAERWVFVKKVVDASEVSKEAKSGVELQSTELAMAFPVAENKEKEQKVSQNLPPKQPLFAFLPLRSYGFRFIIHADFDVPSSREDVIDNLWNQWLRSKIHVLFLEALEHFKSKRNSDPVAEICNFLKFVPREDEILDFFRQVALNIITSLKVSKCLPSMGSVWCYPSQLIICDNPVIRSFVSSDLLFLQTGLNYLHPMVAKCVDRSVLLDMGVQPLNTNHLIQVGKGMLKNLNTEVEEQGQISDSNIRQIYTWLSCIYTSLEDLAMECCDAVESLKTIPFIPLSSGQMVSVDSPASIFFPFSSCGSSLNSGNVQLPKRMIKILEDDINSVDGRMFSRMEEQVSRSHVMNILERVGVKRLSDEDLVKHHILHSLRDEDNKKNLSKELLVAYTTCLKNYFLVNPSTFPTSQVIDSLHLLTSKGMVDLVNSSVYFSNDYNNTVNLQQHLPGYKWTLLDCCYLNGNKSLSNVSTWREFFSHLGVRDFLTFKKQTLTFNKKTLLSSSWKDYAHLLDKNSDICTVDDWTCNEFKELVLANASDPSSLSQMKNLFALVNKFWEIKNDKEMGIESLSKFAQTTLKIKGSGQAHAVPSTFGFLLKTSKWVPTWQPERLSSRQMVITIPSGKIIAESREALSLLGDHVQYVAIKLENLQRNFAEFIGIKLDLDPSYVVQQLIDWSLSSGTKGGVIFQDSASRILSVYNYLEDSLSKTELVKLVTENPVVYCPSKARGRSFFNVNEVCWQDESELIEKHIVTFNEINGKLSGFVPRVLSGIYPASKKDFFIRICNVPLCPSISAYAHILLHISSISAADELTSLEVLRLFAIIEKSLSLESSEDQMDKVATFLCIVGDKSFIPNKAGKWISLLDGPILANNKQYERMFPSCANYINADEEHNREGIQFLCRIGVPKLTEMVDVSPAVEMLQPCPEVLDHFCSVIPYVQRCLYFEFPLIYKYLVEEWNIAEKLYAMKFVLVSKLELVHYFKNNSSTQEQLPRMAVIQKTCQVLDNTVYVQDRCINNYLDINRELASYMSHPGKTCPSCISAQASSCFKELRSLLSEITPLLRNSQETILNNLLEERNISRLPQSEAPWILTRIAMPEMQVMDSLPNQSLQVVKNESPKACSQQEVVTPKQWPPRGNANWPSVSKNHAMPFYSSNGVTHHGLYNLFGNNSTPSRTFQYQPVLTSQQMPFVTNEIPTTKLKDDLEFKANNCQDPDSIGMWGERFVYDYFLKMAAQPDSDIEEVTHVNKDGFTTAPYDILLKRKDGSTTYIEVKSTLMQDKTWFETSLPELLFALEQDKSYQVYRVFSVGQDAGDVRLTKIEHFSQAVTSKQAKLIVVLGDKPEPTTTS